MNGISPEHTKRLFWAGRYTERAFTMLLAYFEVSDQMKAGNPGAYRVFCEKAGIQDIYGSPEEFLRRFALDPDDRVSVYGNLRRAHRCALQAGSEMGNYAAAYLQMALDCLDAASRGETGADLQQVIDYLYAFWGCVDDRVDKETGRNLMKCGKYMERLGLYLRMDAPEQALEKEYSRFLNRLGRCGLPYDRERAAVLETAASQEQGWQRHRQEAWEALSGLLGEIQEAEP